MSIQNMLSVDLEDWYHGFDCIKLLDIKKNNFESRIEKSTFYLLELFAEYNISATFFVLGLVAEKHPNLIRRIYDAGHEIATHGYSHELIYKMTPSSFEDELKRSILICEDITGEKVRGHRASNWSITEASLWAIDILKSCGIEYDSSIFPQKNYLFGISNAPKYIHFLENGLVEIPPSVFDIKGKRIPAPVGGLFLRVLPYSFIKWSIKRINRENQPAMVHFHPWELDLQQPRNIDVPFKNRLIHYSGMSTMEQKIRLLLTDYKFGSIKQGGWAIPGF